MRFEKITVQGMGPFGDASTVDLSQLDAQLVAVTGGNGAGKSTLLELMFGGVFRSCPTRGTLASLATTRQSYVEVDVVNGASYRFRQTLDSHNGKGETLIQDAGGRPVVESGKVRDADAWVKKHLPAPEVLLASTFGAQGGGGSFIDLKPADRKSVLLRALGIEHLEALAEKAREHARELKQRLQVVQARVADERERGGDADAAQAEVEQAEARSETIAAQLAEARQALADLEAEAERAREARRQAQALTERAADLRAREQAARERVSELQRRLENNRGLLARKEEVEAAVSRDAELAALLEQRRSELAEIQEYVRTAERAEAEQRRRWREAQDRARAAEARADRAQARLADRATIEKAVAELPGIRSDVERAERDLREAEEALEEARGLRLAGAEDRIGALRGGLTAIRDGDTTDAAELADDVLTSDDEAVERAQSAPALVAERQRAVQAAQSELRGHRAALEAAQRDAARASDLEAAERDLKEAEQEVRDADAVAAEAERQVESEMEVGAAQTAAANTVQIDIEDTEQLRAALADTLKLAEHLARAEARIEELTPEAEAAAAEADRLAAQLAGIEIPETPALPDVAGPRASLEQLERQQSEAAGSLAVARRRLEEAQASAERLAKLDGERAAVESELADWTRLGQDLGKSGLQAIEVDAAGPELTELVNDLLHSCVSDRWTVRIDTTRMSADGKRQLEGLDVMVIDTERGRDAPVETFSGGERVILGEAVSLALATLATKRAGLTGSDLVRDETGAALDPENGRSYIAMLRRAAELTGARRVLFVSHTPELQELADAQIVIADGKVEVRS